MTAREITEASASVNKPLTSLFRSATCALCTTQTIVQWRLGHGILHPVIEEMPALPVFYFDDPQVGIELRLASQIGFDVGVG